MQRGMGFDDDEDDCQSIGVGSLEHKLKRGDK